MITLNFNLLPDMLYMNILYMLSVLILEITKFNMLQFLYSVFIAVFDSG